MRLLSLSAAILLLTPPCAAAGIDAIWLTCNGNRPDRIVVNWWTDRPGDSVVRFELTVDSLQHLRRQSEQTQLHQIEIPLASRD
jgi:hypothetical protein